MKSGNSNLVPEARDALNGFKMEAARKVGVTQLLNYIQKKPPTARTAAHPGRLFSGIHAALKAKRISVRFFEGIITHE